MQQWLDWLKINLNFITMFYHSLLESLVLCAEFPAFESLSSSGASSSTVCHRYDAICSRQAEAKEKFSV